MAFLSICGDGIKCNKDTCIVSHIRNVALLTPSYAPNSAFCDESISLDLKIDTLIVVIVDE